MRKIYSLVLLATVLLISTNAWGQVSSVQLVNHTNPSASKGYATLQAAIDAVAPGDTATITLLEEQNLTASIVIPNAVGESAETFAARGKVVGRQPQRICLNLNGNNIEGDGALNQCCIALLKGVLHITGEGEINKRGTEKGSFSGWTRAAIAVSGAPGNKNDDTKDFSKDGWWSTLIIDENVTVTAPDNFKSVGLAIMDIGGYIGNSFYANQNAPAFIGVRQNKGAEATDKLGYSCYNAFNALTNATVPAANDIMWSRANSITYQSDGITVKSNTDLQSCSFGVRVVVKGEIYGMNRGIFVFGPINQHPESFPTEGTHKETRTRYTIGNEHPYYYEHYFPWITLASTARVHCKASGTNDEEAGGIYAAGWAVWDINGEIYGQNGMYIKGGDIKLNDANVYSQDATYGNDGWRNGNVAGNGIFITTDEGYAGDMSVEVNGDSRIAGNGGVAIVEVVANVATTPDVNSVTINGGTIEGGSTGAIAVTEATGNNTVAYGGTNIQGATTKGGTESSVAATGTYVTEVTDPVTNKTTIVISDLGPGNSVETVTENLAQTTEDYVKWTGAADQYILEDKTLEYLEMNPSPAVAQKIYVGDADHQATLTVDRVVMGSLAQIIVAPGSKLIITGTDGIVAPKTSNIVLQTSGSKQAEFLFNPAVTSNRHPNATVEMQAKVGKLTVGAEEYREWHRFAVPVLEIKEFGKNPNWSTYLYAWDYVNDDWYKPSSPLEIMKPFEGFTLSPVNEYGDITYTFKGQLVGNDNHNLKFIKEGFNFFGNSYTAYMSVEKLIAQLTEDGSDFEPTIWTWFSNHYHAVPLKALKDNPAAFNDNHKQIKPMQTFILRLVDANEAETELKYNDAIWGNPRYASLINAAPARHAVSNDNTFMRIILSAGEDNADDVMFMEQSKFSDAIDNGYDASKFMNEQGVNIFATVDGSNFSAIATDNVEGKMLSIRTANEATYTLSFSNVKGAEYAIRDNVTNQVIAIEEGASYEFAAQPNTTIEGRFEIISVKKVPTAIENTDVKANVKGIYTLMGQYLGEDFEALPAGVYVVNGVKIVK